eukprot:jgi/Tetstr1/424684/TSEL_015204.t1
MEAGEGRHAIPLLLRDTARTELHDRVVECRIAPGCAPRSPPFAGREYPSRLQTATNLGSSQANRGAGLLGGLPLRGGVSGGCRGGSPASPTSYACAALGALTAAGTAGEMRSRVWRLGWAGLGWAQDTAAWRCQAIIASTNLG